MQILEHKQAAVIRGEHTQQPEHRLANENQRPIVGSLALRLQLRNQPPERRPERIKLWTLRQPVRTQGRRQRFGKWPEWRRQAPRHRPPGQHGEPLLTCYPSDLTGQPRLSDPGLPSQQDRATPARLRPG